MSKTKKQILDEAFYSPVIGRPKVNDAVISRSISIRPSLWGRIPKPKSKFIQNTVWERLQQLRLIGK